MRDDANKLDIPEFLKRKSGERTEAWEASRTPVAAPLPEIKLTTDQQWRKARDTLYALQAAEHYAEQESKANDES